MNELNYDILYSKLYPNAESENGEINVDKKMKELRNRFAIYYSTFSTDGLPNYFHFSPIKKLLFINKIGGASA